MYAKGHPSVAKDLKNIPDLISYGRELHSPLVASSREFLMTDGKFSCASSFAGNTRRYHGLLIDAEKIILSSLHETINGISLLPGWWGECPPDDTLHHILSARLYPVTHEYTLNSALVTRTITLKQGLSIRWEINGTADLTLRPLMTSRCVTELDLDPSVIVNPAQDGYTWNGFHFRCQLPFTVEPQPYYHAWYPAEAFRGYDANENLVSPGYFAGTVSDDIIELQVYPTSNLPPAHSSFDEDTSDLLYRASQLCLREGEVMAGYHWFTQSWGRDTFISMPGLLFAWGKFREAEDIFRKFLSHRKDGLIPNRIPDSYHSSDGPLWLFWALFHYLQTHHDSPFIDEITPDLEALIMAYPETEITHMENNLISVSPCSTWMDTSFTPRGGKPVEVNALWILALEVCDYLEIGTPVSSKQVRKSFNSFWNSQTGCLFDVLDPHDPSIRPNQVIALALGLMPFDEGRRALECIRTHLFTPYGLRTLAPGSVGYKGIYAGDPSYHNGMVWPWLISWYVDALIQYGESPIHASQCLLPLWRYLFTDGAGMLPELFNGDCPYSPAGTVCQAWSIAEIIRARTTVLSLLNPGSGE